jgi:mRNA interferase MazF
VGSRGAAENIEAEAPVRQYEIWWAHLPPPVGRRPVLLLSRNSAYDILNKVIVAEVITTIRDIPVEVRIGRREGLTRPSVANLDNVHVVARADLTGKIGVLAAPRVGEVKRAMGFALDWRELKYSDADER